MTAPYRQGTRPSDLDISNSLEAVWPEVGERLQRALRARGLGPEAAEDIAQEVAARAVETRVQFSSPDDLMRWAWVVGRNLSIDQRRRHERVSLGDVPEQATQPADVVAHQRLAVGAVLAEVAALSAADRAALANVAEEGGRSPGYLAVRRHRLRRKLARVRDAFGGLVLRERVRRGTFDWVPPLASVVPNALMVGAAILGSMGQPVPERVVFAEGGVPQQVLRTAEGSAMLRGLRWSSAEQDRGRHAATGAQEMTSPGSPRPLLPVHPRVRTPPASPQGASVSVIPTPEGPPPPLVCVRYGLHGACVDRPHALPPLEAPER